MVFYIANSVEEIEENNYKLPKAIIEDGAFGYGYCGMCRFMSCLYEKEIIDRNKIDDTIDIDPYDDIIIPIKEVEKLINLYKEAIDPELISFYSDEFNYGKREVDLEDVTFNMKNIIELGEKAIKQGKGLVSLGD